LIKEEEEDYWMSEKNLSVKLRTTEPPVLRLSAACRRRIRTNVARTLSLSRSPAMEKRPMQQQQQHQWQVRAGTW